MFIRRAAGAIATAAVFGDGTDAVRVAARVDLSGDHNIRGAETGHEPSEQARSEEQCRSGTHRGKSIKDDGKGARSWDAQKPAS